MCAQGHIATFVSYCSRGSRALNWAPMIPRDVRLSESCASDCCCFSRLDATPGLTFAVWLKVGCVGPSVWFLGPGLGQNDAERSNLLYSAMIRLAESEMINVHRTSLVKLSLEQQALVRQTRNTTAIRRIAVQHACVWRIRTAVSPAALAEHYRIGGFKGGP